MEKIFVGVKDSLMWCHMGWIMDVQLSGYLVLLLIDSKTRQQDSCTSMTQAIWWYRSELTCWHQAITWTIVDLSSVGFCGIHVRPIPHELLNTSICKVGLNNTLLKLLPHVSRDAGLTTPISCDYMCMKCKIVLNHHSMGAEQGKMWRHV